MISVFLDSFFFSTAFENGEYFKGAVSTMTCHNDFILIIYLHKIIVSLRKYIHLYGAPLSNCKFIIL